MLFKYCNAQVVDKVIREGEIVLRCSRPAEFNDPYELFLGVDPSQDPEILAFYADVVGELPQLPTTCFSRSPAIVPMWAHYAGNSEGFCLGLKRTVLQECYPNSGIGDVDYMERASPELAGHLGMAYQTCKPRHTFLLRHAVFSAAYYSKASHWAYEQECRMVVGDDDIREEGDSMLLSVPTTALEVIIAGPKVSEATQRRLASSAKTIGCLFLQMQIGRSSMEPYFLDHAEQPWVFTAGAFCEAAGACEVCGEPVEMDVDRCSWCRISEAHEREAARRNPFRLLYRHGMLEDYVKTMSDIAGQRSGRADGQTPG